jgi:hypothetical protein
MSEVGAPEDRAPNRGDGTDGVAVHGVGGARGRVAVRRVWCVLAAALALAGCGAAEPAADPVTESQAYDRVETYVRRAAAALPADVHLEASAPATSVACKGEPDRVRVTNSYWIRGLPDRDEHFDAMVRWWTAHEFEMLDDLRPERHYVWVRNPTDGFRMSLRDNNNGELLLGAESPCLTAE